MAASNYIKSFQTYRYDGGLSCLYGRVIIKSHCTHVQILPNMKKGFNNETNRDVT